MKTKVEIEVVCRKTVYLEIEHTEDEDPCDLTRADEKKAKAEAFEWEFDSFIEIESVNEAIV